MASDNDITVRKRRCKDVFDGDLAHYIPGSSDDAQTYSKKAEWWAVKWPDAEDDGKVDDLDYSSKKWAVYTDGPVDTANNLFSSKQYALNAEEQAGISLTWANKSQEWAESDTVIEGTETSHSSKYWSGISKQWSDDALSYSQSASNAQQMAWKWAQKTDGPVTGDQYSAKYWADKAEERSGGSEQWSIISHNWANGGLAEGATQPSSTDTNSSLYWAYQSAQSAAAADQYQQQAYSYQEESKRQKQDAVTARTGAETAQVKAETAQRLAETAQTAAETAQTAAETAQGKAEDAQEAAETAQAAAETAQTAAETAQTKSEQAQDAAEAAQTAAETAQGKAESAQNVAEAAQTAAEVAQGKAEDAQTAAETAQGKAEEAQTAAETAQDAAETAQDITEAARDRAQEWAESDQAITVPEDTDTHYSAKKHAQDALDTFGLTANVYAQTVGVYNDTTVASAAAHGHADDAMRANESAQEAKGDAIDAQTAAETAQAAAEAARDLAQEWADNDEDAPVTGTENKYSSKHWSIKAQNAVASLGNVAMRDVANVFEYDNQFNGNVAIGQLGTPGDKAKCQLNRTSGNYNASGALIDNLGRYMLITDGGASNKTNFITYINNHSSDLDITASAADGNYIYLEAKVAGTYANEIEYYAVGSFYDNNQGSTTQGTKTAGTDEVKAQCQVSLASNLGKAGCIVYTKGGVVKGVAVAPALSGSRTLQELADLINEKEDLDFTAEVSGTNLILTNKEFGADTTVYYRNGCFNAVTHLKVKQGSLVPGTEDIPGSDNTLTLNGESVPTHFGNNEYAGINIFTGPVGIQSTGSFTNNGVTALNGPIQGSGTVGGSVLASDEAVAFGIARGLFERDQRIAPVTAYVLYGPNEDSPPALLSMPSEPLSAADMKAVYSGNIPPRYVVFRGNWRTSSPWPDLIVGKWSWGGRRVSKMTIYWAGMLKLPIMFSSKPQVDELELIFPDATSESLSSFCQGTQCRSLKAVCPKVTSTQQFWLMGNGNDTCESIELYFDSLVDFKTNHIYPAGYNIKPTIIKHFVFYAPSLSKAEKLLQWGTKFALTPQADFYNFLSVLPDWTESTAEAYRTAITQYNDANPDTPITVEDDATLAELYAAVEEHNTQYPDSKCTVTQPHPIGLAAVENCYAAVAQWLDDGGIPYTREPGHAPAAVLPYGWSISYLS